MELNLMVAGFGGQGVMMVGKLLSQATCDSTDYNVTFFPSYGAQQRGGTANCYVVISDKEVGSPKPTIVDQLIVMNDVSMVKFRQNVKSGGIIFTNSSLVHSGAERDDVRVVPIPVTEMAMELGSLKVLNIVMLGAYIGYTGLIEEGLVLDCILRLLGKKPEFIEMNKTAFAKGLAAGKNARAEIA